MKTKIGGLISVLIILSFCATSFGQSQVITATIKVYGNCTMCKKRIETALDRKGIKQAEWNPRTKDLIVTYNIAKISEQQIHEIVAAVGHDTDKVKADDEVYAALPFCCLYRDGDNIDKSGDHHQQ